MASTAQTVRWGIAATGGIAERFANGLALVPGARLAAVASRTAERAEAFGERHGAARAYGSYEALAEDPDVDVVYVASPNHRHHADTLLFLEAGRHVLCEKPFALNEGQARDMVVAARQRGLFLMEALWSRFLPAYVVLAALLEEGRIGEPLLVEGDFGFRRTVEADHRLFDLALGGGALLDLGIYPVQLASLVLGPPDRVAAVGHIGETGVDEQVAATLHHPGGQLAVVKAAIRIGSSCTARISGTHGWIHLPAFMHCPTHLDIGGRAPERVECGFDGEGLRFQVEHVQHCLRKGWTESPVVPLDETCTMAATLDAVRAQIGLRYPGEEAQLTPP
jgi:predicted dehydrogenase